MSRQYWSELIVWNTANGTAVANTTTETIIFPDVNIPANYVADGRVLRLRCQGALSTTATPTMIFSVRWGTVTGTVICKSGAITQGSGVTSVIWDFVVLITCRANGVSGSVFAIGVASVGSASTLTNMMGSAGATVPAAVTIDESVDKALSVTATWSAASASNTLTGHNYYLESLN